MVEVTVIVLAIITIIVLLGLFSKRSNELCTSKKSLAGKTALITGGTLGMGLEVAKDFANRKAKVIIACPFKEEGDKARKEIEDKTGSDKVVFKLLDLGSLESTREFAKDILISEERLDILVNNAGVGTVGDFLSEDGLNYVMQVNYLGHFLLTLLLLPLLIKTGTQAEPSRIVNLSSILHYFGRADVKKFKISKAHRFQWMIYADSKFCFIPFSRELTRRLKGVNVVINNVDPGVVGTTIYDSVGKLSGKIALVCFSWLSKTAWEGAQTTLHVCLDAEAGEVSGELFRNCKLTRAKGSAYNDKIAKTLWEESVKCVKLKDVDACLKSL